MAVGDGPADRDRDDVGENLDEVAARLRFLQAQLEEIAARQEAAARAASSTPPFPPRGGDGAGERS